MLLYTNKPVADDCTVDRPSYYYYYEYHWYNLTRLLHSI
jgi:hypothetical protein